MGKILIVEDDVDARTIIVQMVKNIDIGLEIYETGAAEVALHMARENEIDVFILDIQLEDYSGIELGLQLREIDTYKLTPIIFMSGAINREFEAYRHIHCYTFLEKPFNQKDIKRALETVINYGIINKEEKLRIHLKYKNMTYIIAEDDIIFIERKNRKLIIATRSQDIIHVSSLKKIREQLSNHFVQCHESFIINKAVIRKISYVEHSIYLENVDKAIPIGRSYMDVCKSLFEMSIYSD